MSLVSTVTLACTLLLMCGVQRIEAQTYERVQPIVLTGSPCGPSPARIAPQPTTLLRGVSYMSPSMSESIPPVSSASELVPLPMGPLGHVSAYASPSVDECCVFAPVVPLTDSVKVLRPTNVPTVPAGYVLGQGLIGQPKLYKPGEPVRNFLRYISL
ncbi:MAG: hypothetical protein ACYC4U_13100 [Pirellulaceae bacterium]